MNDDAIPVGELPRTMVFESTDSQIVVAVERALTRAAIPFQVMFERQKPHQYGPSKPPRQFLVAPDFEAAAREVVEQAVLRRGRVLSLQPKPLRPSGFGDTGGGSGVDFFGFDGGGDCHHGGGDGGHCH